MADLSDSNVRQRVAELLQEGPRRGVARLIAEHTGVGADLERLALIVRALCADNSPWIKFFKQRIHKRGKCPSGVKTIIRSCLTTPVRADVPGERLTASDVLRRERISRSSGTLAIKEIEELGFGDAYRFFIAKLRDLRTQQETPIDLEVHIECDHVYIHGLALLAAWCERWAARVRLTASSDRVRRYLDKTGFKRVVEGRVTIDTALYDEVNHVALTRIDREDLQRADDVARRLSDLFARHMGLDRNKKFALATVFAELVENVYRHAQSNYPSYVMAQAFPKTRKLHVVIADTGIGIYASFRESDRRDVQDRAVSEAETLNLAFEKLVTSKAEKHAGYGLYVVRRLVEENGGTIRLTSGRTTKLIGLPAGRWRRARARQETTEHLPWTGTELSLIFNLDRPLPLREVYEELGPPDRREDFFD